MSHRRVQVELHDLVIELDVVAPVEQARPVDDGLAVVLEPRGLGDRLVDDGLERAVGRRAERDALPGGGAVAEG